MGAPEGNERRARRAMDPIEWDDVPQADWRAIPKDQGRRAMTARQRYTGIWLGVAYGHSAAASRAFTMGNFIAGLVCLALFVLLAFSPYFIALYADRTDRPKAQSQPVQFSLQRLMVAIAVIAMGLSLVLYTFRGPSGFIRGLSWITGGTLIGAGIFVPTREWIQGGCLGLLATLLSSFVYLTVE